MIVIKCIPSHSIYSHINECCVYQPSINNYHPEQDPFFGPLFYTACMYRSIIPVSIGQIDKEKDPNDFRHSGLLQHRISITH